MDSVEEPAAEKETIEKKCDFKNSPEFAGICSFINYFGSELGVHLTFSQLEKFLKLEDCKELKTWETLHVKLLNKLKYRARPDRWEPVLARFLLSNVHRLGNPENAIDILMNTNQPNDTRLDDIKSVQNTRNYCKLSASVRAKVLFYLLESQFERNQGFKDKVNLKNSLELRFTPLGVDVWGRVYWLMKDSEVNILIYREDRQQFNLSLICESFDQMRNLANELRNACPPEEKLSIILMQTINGFSDQDVFEQSITTDDVDVKSFLWDSLVPPKEILSEYGCEQSKLESSTVCNSTLSEKCAVNISSSPECINPLKVDEHSEPTSNDVDKMEVDVLTNGLSTEHPDAAISVGEDNVDSKICTDPVNLPIQPKLEESSQEECISTSKSKSKGRPKQSKKDHSLETLATMPADVRRSGRQRKPVQVFVVEPPQPKRPKVNKNPPIGDLNSSRLSEKKDYHPAKAVKKRSKIHIKQAECNGLSDKKHKKKKKKRRHGKKGRKSSNPWVHASSSSESDDGDELFDKALFENPTDHSDNSDIEKDAKKRVDWSDLPESDFDPNGLDSDSDVDSLIKGRNLARQKRLQLRLSTDPASVLNTEPEEPCQICLKTHLPEWLLLCDKCDRGHHAMCLRPPLFIIPEGDWFCPRCQHMGLVTALDETATALENEQKKQGIWKRMQERLNFVNISMTNILCDGDEENEGGGTLGRHRRAKINTKYVEASSDDSEEDEEVSVDEQHSFINSAEETGQSDSDASKTGSSRSSNRHRRSHRKMPSRRAKAQVRSNVRRAARLIDYSDECTEYSSSDEESDKPGPRNTRKRQVQYKLDDAFKVLDDALEADEKYQEEKRKRLKQKQRASRVSGDDDHNDNDDKEESDDSDHPAGRSRGKDLSNILGPDWKEFDDDDKPAHPRAKRRRIGGRLSSSSSDESGGSGHPNKRRKDDSDFKPSEDSETEESEKTPPSDMDSVSSSNSWLSTRRRKKSGRSLRTKRVSGFSKGRKRIPRFEGSDGDLSSDNKPVVSRSRRCARAVISYRESENEGTASESEAAADEDRKPIEPKRKAHISESESESLERPPLVLSSKSKGIPKSNRRRDNLASSGSDYKPADDSSTDVSEEIEEDSETQGREAQNSGSQSESNAVGLNEERQDPADNSACSNLYNNAPSPEFGSVLLDENLKSDSLCLGVDAPDNETENSTSLLVLKPDPSQSAHASLVDRKPSTLLSSFLTSRTEEEEVEDEAEECISSRHFKHSVSNALVIDQEEAQPPCLSPDLF